MDFNVNVTLTLEAGKSFGPILSLLSGAVSANDGAQVEKQKAAKIKPTEEPAAKKTKVKQESETSEVTLQMVRDITTEKANVEDPEEMKANRKAIKNILTAFEVGKSSDLPEEKYSEYYEAIKAL